MGRYKLETGMAGNRYEARLVISMSTIRRREWYWTRYEGEIDGRRLGFAIGTIGHVGGFLRGTGAVLAQEWSPQATSRLPAAVEYEF
jgi:hypothetical protein